MPNKILTSYKTQSDSDFMITTDKVATQMEGNANYTNPPEALATIKKLSPELRSAILAAGNRDRIKTSAKNDLRAAVEAALDELVKYVTQVANGDRTMLLTSGFELASPRTDAKLGIIAALDVTMPRANEATTRIKRVRSARAYIHRYTVDPVTPDSIWTSKVLTDLSHTFTGLTSREKYVFQVIAVGYKGQESLSPMVSMVIQ